MQPLGLGGPERKCDLVRDETYTLPFATGEADSYLASSGFPPDYSPYDSACESPWHDAQAEHSADGGATWSGFAGTYHPSRHLGLLLTIVGMVRSLP